MRRQRKLSISQIWDSASNVERNVFLYNLGYTNRDYRTAFNRLSRTKQIKVLTGAKTGTNYLENKPRRRRK